MIKNMELTNNKEIEALKTDIKTLQEEKAQLKEDIKNLNKTPEKELTFQDYAKIFMEGLN
jgi:predicted  nucleic acid-binding Zn-ribbon protein